MKVLVVNAGSSSLKYQLFETTTGDVLAKGICERIGIDGLIEHRLGENGQKNKRELAMPNHAVAMKIVVDTLTDPTLGCLTDMAEIKAVGHRVVHGGPYFFESCLVTPEVIEKLKLIHFKLGHISHSAHIYTENGSSAPCHASCGVKHCSVTA